MKILLIILCSLIVANVGILFWLITIIHGLQVGQRQVDDKLRELEGKS